MKNSPAENQMTLVCPLINQRSNAIRETERPYMTYYVYFIQTLVIRCTINEIQPLERSVTLI